MDRHDPDKPGQDDQRGATNLAARLRDHLP
jgi:hypothetical protein